VKLFRDPRLSSAVGALGLVFFGMIGALFFLSFYLQSVRGYSPLSAGLLTLPFAAGQMLLAPRSARLVRRYGTKAVAATGLITVALALAGYLLLGVSTPIWVLGVIFFVQGAGMGSVMPPATEAVMSVVPRERAGSGSALTNTTRQVAGALGVAVLGSIIAQLYRDQLSPHLTALPAAARSAATGSITATQTAAAQLGSAGARLDGFANTAFVHSMHVATAISAVITLAGALVVLVWMPGRAAAASPVAQPAAPSGDAQHEDTVVVQIPSSPAGAAPLATAEAAAQAGPLATAEVPAAARAEVEG